MLLLFTDAGLGTTFGGKLALRAGGRRHWSIEGHIKESKGVNAVYSAILLALNIGLAWFSRVRCCHEWMRTLVLQRALGLVVVIGLAVAGLVWPGGEPTSSWGHSANGAIRTDN